VLSRVFDAPRERVFEAWTDREHKTQRDATVGFGGVELGYQTLDKLAEHLRQM
jgi:hypothetical protein